MLRTHSHVRMRRNDASTAHISLYNFSQKLIIHIAKLPFKSPVMKRKVSVGLLLPLTVVIVVVMVRFDEIFWCLSAKRLKLHRLREINKSYGNFHSLELMLNYTWIESWFTSCDADIWRRLDEQCDERHIESNHRKVDEAKRFFT